jgi:hypothetical protein
MELIGKALGRLAMLGGAALVLYLGFVTVNGTVGAVSAGRRADPDEQNRKSAEQLFEQGRRSSASTLLATKPSGVTPCSCTARSKGRRSAVSDRG